MGTGGCTVLRTKMKGSSLGCFETHQAVGIMTFVWKFFIAHDKYGAM
jgi:hypothetical protein